MSCGNPRDARGSAGPPARRHRARRHAVLALAAALAAGAAPSSAAEQPDAGASATDACAYFPLAEGTRWVYRERTGLFGTRNVVMTARRPQSVEGLDRALVIVHEIGDRPFFGIDDEGLLGFLVEDGFVVRFSGIGEDSRGGLRVFGGEGLRILPTAPRDGQRWEQRLHLFSVPGSRGAPRQWTAEIERRDSIRVRAGRFDDVVRVRMRYWDPSLSDGSPQITYEDDYARGVGLVKSVARNHEAGAWRKVVRELEEFRPADSAAACPSDAPRAYFDSRSQTPSHSAEGGSPRKRSQRSA